MSANETLDLSAIEARLADVRALPKRIPGAMDAVVAEIAAFDIDTLIAAVRERDAEIARLKRTVAFFACTIKAGESWSEQCEAALGEALRQTGTEPPQPAEGV